MFKKINYEFMIKRCLNSKPNLKFYKNKQNKAPINSNLKYLCFIVPIVSAALGTWQIQRRKQKLKLINDLNEKLNFKPISLPDNLKELENLEYRKVIVKGRFDHSKEFIVAPRCINIENENPMFGGLVSTGKQNGGWVITPFKLSDRNYSILVNRGWVPLDYFDQNKRLKGQVENEISLVGVIRHSENKNLFTLKNDPSKNIWVYRDVEKMAYINGCAPVFIDVDKESSVPGGPIGGQTRINLRNEHSSYILTWYLLSFITFLMSYHFVKKV